MSTTSIVTLPNGKKTRFTQRGFDKQAGYVRQQLDGKAVTITGFTLGGDKFIPWRSAKNKGLVQGNAPAPFVTAKGASAYNPC